MAVRYGIGVGRAGFSWSGRAIVAYKREWPRWTPPDEMVARQPQLEPYSILNGGMDPGLHNPLGARSLYIHKDGKDIPVVIVAAKHGFVFVFDRRDGTPIWPIEERPVPASDVPGEHASPTQPFPTWPLPFARQ